MWRPRRTVPHVILMLDGDVTGRKASKVIAEKLWPMSTVQIQGLPLGPNPTNCRQKQSERCCKTV